MLKGFFWFQKGVSVETTETLLDPLLHYLSVHLQMNAFIFSLSISYIYIYIYIYIIKYAST